MKLYVVYDAEGVHSCPVYGVFTSMDAAEDACDQLTEKFVKECFAVDPKESGLVPEYDKHFVTKQCRQSLAIQIIEKGLDVLI